MPQPLINPPGLLTAKKPTPIGLTNTFVQELKKVNTIITPVFEFTR